MKSEEDLEILEAAIRIILKEGRVSISFTQGEISISLPTTRRLAEHLDIPHYYVLPRFAAMERDGLIRRVERVGISTTPRGTETILAMIEERYSDAVRTIVPEGLLEVLRASHDRR